MQVTSPLLDPFREVFRSAARAPGLVGDLIADPESPFRTILEDLPAPFLVVSPQGNLMYANVAWRMLRNSTLEDVIGRPIADLLTDAEQPMLAATTEQLNLLTPENRTTNVRFSLDDAVFIEVIFHGWFDENGSMLAVSGLANNRTEAQIYENELESANRALEESNRDLQDFAHIASHDLQEPLRKISAFSERLEQRCGDQLDDRGRDYLTRISGASDRMQQLIHSLLDYSRVNSRAGAMTDTDLNEVLRLVLSDLVVRIEETDAKIIADELPVVQGDPTQMRQLFQNLLGNALKFRSPGVQPVVRITHECDGEQHYISVIDNGIGFDAEAAEKIFAPFHRLHARSDYDGSGIGLSVCKRIVDRHSGTITAISTPGDGAEFKVVLDAQKGSDPSPSGGV